MKIANTFLTLLFVALTAPFALGVRVTVRRPRATQSVSAGEVQFRVRIILSRGEVNDSATVTSFQIQLGTDGTFEDLDIPTNFNPRGNGRSIANVSFTKTITETVDFKLKVMTSTGSESETSFRTLTVTANDDPNDGPNDPDGPVTDDDPNLPINAASAAIRQAIRNFGRNGALRAKFVRLGFHDCVGGCDGCIDLENIDNFGLEVPIEALRDVVTQYSTDSFTRADIWALAAMIGANDAQTNDGRVDYTMTVFGRSTCDSDSGYGGPNRTLPSTNSNSRELAEFFADNFGFGSRETAAILGAHSIGEMSQESSGFEGQWVNGNRRLQNDYYRGLVGDNGNSPEEQFNDAPNWNVVEVDNSANSTIPNRFQWRRGGGGGGGGPPPGGNRLLQQNRRQVMTNADIALVRNFEGFIDTDTGEVTCRFRRRNACPHATQFQDAMIEFRNSSNGVFLEAFHDAFMRVLHQSTSGSDLRLG